MSTNISNSISTQKQSQSLPPINNSTYVTDIHHSESSSFSSSEEQEQQLFPNKLIHQLETASDNELDNLEGINGTKNRSTESFLQIIQHTGSSHQRASSTSLPSSQANCCTWKQIVKLTFSIAATSICTYFIAHNHFAQSKENILLAVGTGLSTQQILQNIFPKKFSNIEKNFIIDYSQGIFFVITQIYLNFQNAAVQTPCSYLLLFLLGAQITAMFNTVRNTNQKWDRTDEADASHRTGYRICTKLLAFNTPLLRRMSTLPKLLLGIGLSIYGTLDPHPFPYKAIILKTGRILSGYGIGQILYELIHFCRIRLENNFVSDKFKRFNSILSDLMPGPPLGLRASRIVEKSLFIFSAIFTGASLGFDASWADYGGGMLAGIQREIDWISFTRTPVYAIEELQNKKEAVKTPWMITTTRIANFSKWMFACVALPAFLIREAIQGKTPDRIALGTFAAFLYPSYWAAFLLGKQTLNRFSTKLQSTLYFYLNYSQSAPIIFIIISHEMDIGSKSVTNSDLLQTIFPAIAYAALGYDLGIHAGHRASPKNRPYPAILNPFLALYTYYFAAVFFRR